MSKKVSIVIPCYNEKENIIEVVKTVKTIPDLDLEIVVVDDCSKDGTREILETQVKPMVSKIVYHEVNQGKGAALRTGFKHITGDVAIIQDADLEYDPLEIPALVRPILDGEAKVVYGSRFKGGWKKGGYTANRIANVGLTRFSNLFTHQKITDMETCYKAFASEVIKAVKIEENRFGFEPEITAKISDMGIKIKELPISYKPRTNEEGKKIGFKDGVRAIICIFKYH